MNRRNDPFCARERRQALDHLRVLAKMADDLSAHTRAVGHYHEAAIYEEQAAILHERIETETRTIEAAIRREAFRLVDT